MNTSQGIIVCIFSALSLSCSNQISQSSERHEQAENKVTPTIYAKGNVVRDGETYLPAWVKNQVEIEKVLKHSYECAPTIELRYQSLRKDTVTESCELLLATEARFQQLFKRTNKPVLHDHNTVLRTNIYASREDYVKYVTKHFDVPSNNGGMYLEGLPHMENNSAEYVAYLKKGSIWNLNHEFVHYLDGRFNNYGDFCATPHDNHLGPEYCAKPAPLPPYLIWWTEGIAEYVAHMNNNPKAVALASKQSYKLSELFYTSNANWSTERVYRWGYLAVRYMMENQRDKVEQMLFFTRRGDYPRYQALVKQWGTSMDEDFDAWLASI